MAEALKVLIVIERLERSLETFEIVRCQSVLLIHTISFLLAR